MTLNVIFKDGLRIGWAPRAGARFVYAAFGVTMRDGQRDYFLNGLDRAFPGMGEQYRKRYGAKPIIERYSSPKIAEHLCEFCIPIIH